MRHLYSVLIFIISFISLFFLGQINRPQLLIGKLFWGNNGLLIQCFIISTYSYFLFNKMINVTLSQKWRNISWTLFSIIFFLQLFLGIFVSKQFLLTGELHFPIPAIIVAGPIYRGSNFFMPILLLSTVLISGSSWCSYFCYIGPLDMIVSKLKRSKNNSIKVQGSLAKSLRPHNLISIIILPLILKAFGLNTNFTIYLVLIYIIATSLFIYRSYNSKKMIHCSKFCPIGLLVNFVSKLSPFKISINNSCSKCMKCIKSCKYDALSKQSIQSKSTLFNCTLCGDCVSSCGNNSIEYNVFKLRGKKARTVYIFIIVWIHTIFLAVARI